MKANLNPTKHGRSGSGWWRRARPVGDLSGVRSRVSEYEAYARYNRLLGFLLGLGTRVESFEDTFPNHVNDGEHVVNAGVLVIVPKLSRIVPVQEQSFVDSSGRLRFREHRDYHESEATGAIGALFRALPPTIEVRASGNLPPEATERILGILQYSPPR